MGEDFLRAAAEVGRAAGEEFVEDGSEGVDVGGDGGWLAGGEFRGHVGRGAEETGGEGELRVVGGIGEAGEAEVGDAGFAIGGEEDVRRFEVAVEDALLVGVGDGAGGFFEETGGGGWGGETGAEGIGEGAALDEFHGVVGLPVAVAEVEDGDDAVVAETGGGLGFAAEAACEIW